MHDAQYELFECTVEENDQDKLDYQYIMDMYNTQYGFDDKNPHYATHSRDLVEYIMRKWNVYMLSLGDLTMTKADVKGPRIGLCANGIGIGESRIDASGRGCMHDSGLGQGRISEDCAAPGGSHGGEGGYGATQTMRENKIYAASCEDHRPMPYYLGHEARYEGSGGGSGDSQTTSGGSGGGVVWLTTPQTMILIGETVLAANGRAGEAPERD